MTYELLVALKVTDDIMYQAYREAMAPILVQFGGRFCYDFSIANVLKAQKGEAINRVFTLNFPSEQDKNDFFNDDAYQVVKARYFENSVAEVHILASYDKD
ncbi:DUF1330 domain-containing protein [Marinomonas sp. 42_23_T18]|nr:DUF1330 domain-containing protein [Marinomonas sp. 42_23_T18]